jgi:hypothetical protein
MLDKHLKRRIDEANECIDLRPDCTNVHCFRRAHCWPCAEAPDRVTIFDMYNYHDLFTGDCHIECEKECVSCSIHV